MEELNLIDYDQKLKSLDIKSLAITLISSIKNLMDLSK